MNDRPTTMYDPSGFTGVVPSMDPKDVVRAGLQRLLELLPNDPDCIKFLCKEHIDPIQSLKQLLSSGYFRADAIPLIRDSAGNVTGVWHAATGYEQGQAITVNTLGGFFSSAYDVGIGGGRTVRGGTSLAQGFILLHELGHLTKSTRPDLGHQDVVDQNDNDLAKNCKELVKALRGR